MNIVSGMLWLQLLLYCLAHFYNYEMIPIIVPNEYLPKCHRMVTSYVQYFDLVMKVNT